MLKVIAEAEEPLDREELLEAVNTAIRHERVGSRHQ